MSPYQPFALIERNQLKRVTDDSTLFSSFITDIQSYISLFSAYIAIFTKILGKPALFFETKQYKDFTASLALSICNETEDLFPTSFDSIPRAHWFNLMDFRESDKYSDCLLTTKPVIILALEQFRQTSQNSIIYPKHQATII